jgi:hypothetical protein
MSAVRKPKAGKPQLIAVDGVDPAALLIDARAVLGTATRGGISKWDASGVFQELAVADAAAGQPSARTLLLLYAADLAFRLRWQIRPALAEGRTVVAAPYVCTAYAFGRAAGLSSSWLMNLFRFAPRANAQRFAHSSGARAGAVVQGFVAFSADRIADAKGMRRRIVEGTAAELRDRYDRNR